MENKMKKNSPQEGVKNLAVLCLQLSIFVKNTARIV
jgi:hypothetical protein